MTDKKDPGDDPPADDQQLIWNATTVILTFLSQNIRGPGDAAAVLYTALGRLSARYGKQDQKAKQAWKDGIKYGATLFKAGFEAERLPQPKPEDTAIWFKCKGCGCAAAYLPDGLPPYYAPGAVAHTKPLEAVNKTPVQCSVYQSLEATEYWELHKDAERVEAPSNFRKAPDPNQN